MTTEMVLRRLQNQRSYDILMNGFSLQSTTTPRKANKGIENALQEIAPSEAFGLVFEPFEYSPELSIYRSLGGTIEAEKTCVVEPDRGKWVVKSAFGIVKHGGVTPINLGKSRPPP
ncbi:unnamed protein product [Prunus armeniaca]